MNRMSRVKPTVWIAIAFGVLFIGAVAFSTFRLQPFRCRVCITFNGQTDCRTASAQTREEAQRSATSTACAQISSGVSESIRCENTPPQSLEWLH
jgi:hypothetical protein